MENKNEYYMLLKKAEKVTTFFPAWYNKQIVLFQAVDKRSLSSLLALFRCSLLPQQGNSAPLKASLLQRQTFSTSLNIWQNRLCLHSETNSFVWLMAKRLNQKGEEVMNSPPLLLGYCLEF